MLADALEEFAAPKVAEFSPHYLSRDVHNGDELGVANNVSHGDASVYARTIGFGTSPATVGLVIEFSAAPAEVGWHRQDGNQFETAAPVPLDAFLGEKFVGIAPDHVFSRIEKIAIHERLLGYSFTAPIVTVSAAYVKVTLSNSGKKREICPREECQTKENHD